MRGYTIIEVAVVTFLIVLLTSFVFIFHRPADDLLKLNRAAQKAAQDTRRAMNLALETRVTTCNTGTFTGYGMYLQAAGTSYTLFRNCVHTPPPGPPGDFMEVVETIFIESGVEIADVAFLNEGAVWDPAVRVLFLPPDPTTEIREDRDLPIKTDSSGVNITLRLQNDPSATKTIRITPKGVIDIQ